MFPPAGNAVVSLPDIGFEFQQMLATIERRMLAHNSHRNGQTERGEEPIIDR